MDKERVAKKKREGVGKKEVSTGKISLSDRERGRPQLVSREKPTEASSGGEEEKKRERRRRLRFRRYKERKNWGKRERDQGKNKDLVIT